MKYGKREKEKRLKDTYVKCLRDRERERKKEMRGCQRETEKGKRLKDTCLKCLKERSRERKERMPKK